MIACFGENVSIQPDELRGLVFQCLEKKFPTIGKSEGDFSKPRKKVLILPPDHTRLNSQAGPITAIAYEWLTVRGVQVDILPTLGTHNPMTEKQLRNRFAFPSSTTGLS